MTLPSRRILAAALAAAATAALGASGCGGTTTYPAGTSATTSTFVASSAPPMSTRAGNRHTANAGRAAELKITGRTTGAAAAALAKLPVKGRAPKTGYSRKQFGDGWIDTAGCDTRDRILTRDLMAKTYVDDCRVESGTLADPYTAERIDYIRGGASEVDIDHVVALSDAWQKGAQQWAPATRVALANDPLELLAVDAHTNRAKGDGDAATWLPPNKAYRCAYVARQVAVKTKYRLWVTGAEKDAIGRVLARCPGQTLPKAGAPIRVIATRTPPPTHTPSRSTPGHSHSIPSRRTPGRSTTGHSTPSPSTASGSGGGSGTGHVYANCAAARAAGVTPILRGTPDYAANPKLDRDHDGVACES